jgi:hypothetical protein
MLFGSLSRPATPQARLLLLLLLPLLLLLLLLLRSTPNSFSALLHAAPRCPAVMRGPHTS